MEIQNDFKKENNLNYYPPKEVKPSKTIQDAYLQCYFMGFNNNNHSVSSKPNLKNNDNTEIKKIIQSINNTNKEDLQSSAINYINPNTENLIKENKFSNRKTNRDKNEIDPLKSLNKKIINSDYVRNQVNSYQEEKIETIPINVDNSKILMANNTEKIEENISSVIENKITGIKNNVIIKSAEIYRLNQTTIAGNKNLNTGQIEHKEDELVPLVIRNKLKNKK